MEEEEEEEEEEKEEKEEEEKAVSEEAEMDVKHVLNNHVLFMPAGAVTNHVFKNSCIIHAQPEADFR